MTPAEQAAYLAGMEEAAKIAETRWTVPSFSKACSEDIAAAIRARIEERRG